MKSEEFVIVHLVTALSLLASSNALQCYVCENCVEGDDLNVLEICGVITDPGAANPGGDSGSGVGSTTAPGSTVTLKKPSVVVDEGVKATTTMTTTTTKTAAQVQPPQESSQQAPQENTQQQTQPEKPLQPPQETPDIPPTPQIPTETTQQTPQETAEKPLQEQPVPTAQVPPAQTPQETPQQSPPQPPQQTLEPKPQEISQQSTQPPTPTPQQPTQPSTPKPQQPTQPPTPTTSIPHHEDIFEYSYEDDSDVIEPLRQKPDQPQTPQSLSAAQNEAKPPTAAKPLLQQQQTIKNETIAITNQTSPTAINPPANPPAANPPAGGGGGSPPADTDPEDDYYDGEYDYNYDDERKSVQAKGRSAVAMRQQLAEPVCFVIQKIVNNTLVTNRGCASLVRNQTNRQFNCQDIYPNGNVKDCYLCEGNGCNKVTIGSGASAAPSLRQQQMFAGKPKNLALSLVIMMAVISRTAIAI